MRIAGSTAVSGRTDRGTRHVAKGRRFICWPDADAAGRQHMAEVAPNLYRAGATAVRTIAYTPYVAIWPKGADARDFIGGADPVVGALTVATLIEDWSLPVGKPGPAEVEVPRARRMARGMGSVSDALIALGVANARPGTTVRCPRHGDRHASLSVLSDDRRAICKSVSCEWSGRGVIASDIAVLVSP